MPTVTNAANDRRCHDCRRYHNRRCRDDPDWPSVKLTSSGRPAGRLKVFLAASAALLLSLTCINDASAEGGCGPGFHINLTSVISLAAPNNTIMKIRFA